VPRPGEAHRILAARESTRLDAESHGFLWRLEDCGVLDAESRERVLERIVAAPVDALSLDQIKLVVLMVLWQRGEASGAQVAEDAYFGTGARSLH
jgi:Smg protein